MEIKEFIYKMTNREKSMQATKHKFWCGHCDAALVGDVGKCPVCGKKNNSKKRKAAKKRLK